MREQHSVASSVSDKYVILSALLCIFVVSRVVKFLNGLKTVGDIPGPRVPFSPMLPPGALFRTSWWNPSNGFVWEWRLWFYKKWGSDFVSFVPFIFGPPIIFTSSLEVARQIVAGGPQSVWIKPKLATLVLEEWGRNLVTTNKEDWRRHRRIMGPAFNNSMYSLVWAETMRVYRDMVSAEGWTNKDTVILQPVQDYTVRVALFVISACGFGLPFRWEEPPVNEDGSMGFQEAMRIWVDTVLLRVIAPKWVYKLPLKGLRKIATSTQVLQEYMGRMIAERKAEINGGEAVKGKERRDVFSLLVRANEEEGKDGKRKLEDSELFGNVFAMLFAGHETTAFTLAATVGFLGIYPQIQEDVYQQIIEVVGHDRDPTFEDFPRLEKVANAFYEALRLYPAAHFMIRAPSEDTILTVPTGDGTSTRPVPIQKDLHVIVDMTGIQYNPRYFPNPYKYDPTRWRGITTESEDVTAFSVGPRTCIGRKFAAVEAVCFLTFLLKDWAVEPIMNPGETGEQWRERVMHAQTKMTLCVDPVPVRLLRRRPATST